jgi:hypothetical protein
LKELFLTGMEMRIAMLLSIPFDVVSINDAAFLCGCVGLEARIASFNPK